VPCAAERGIAMPNYKACNPNEKTIREHMQLLHDLAKGVDGKLVLARFGEDPVTGLPIAPYRVNLI